MSITLEKEVENLRQKAANLETKIHTQNQVITTLETNVEIYKTDVEVYKTKYEVSEGEREKTELKYQYAVEEYEKLRQAFLSSQRQAFGKKSERFVDEAQLPLFEKEIDQKEIKESDIEKITYTRKKKKDKQADMSLLPQREEIIEVPKEQKVCGCGNEKQVIRYETKHILNYQPAIVEVIVQKREVCACKKGCDTSIVTAAVPKHILPKCRASESLLSHIAVSKVLDRAVSFGEENRKGTWMANL